MKSLVGYTGFVGSNIAPNGEFDNLYNSKNISEAFGTKPDLLVYAGVRAEMFLANNFPEKDFDQIKEAFENIKKIEPKQIVLISTISVYGENPCGDEDTIINENQLTAYGKNRLWLENKVSGNFSNHLIVRLPALYGKNIKKNFIFDYIYYTPSMLKGEKYLELKKMNPELEDYYKLQDNGFYKCRKLKSFERKNLIELLKSVNFSALNFTDSRSKYQFYNLHYLWGHISKALDIGIKKLNITSEPVYIAELYEYLEGKSFINELSETPFNQNLLSKYSDAFNGKNGYLFNKDFELDDIKKFVIVQKKAEGLL